MEVFKSEYIDKGTFGRVYKVLTKGGTFALKKFQEPDGISTSILNEIIFLSDIQHENIIEKLALYIENDMLHLMMPYIPLTLYQFIKGLKSSLIKRIEIMDVIFNKLLVAMEFMHKNFYIHADIKPTNIMIDPDNIDNVKFIDFGSAFNEVLVNKFNCYSIQTIWYRAPEMIKKQRYNYKIDIWSLGLVYLEMLTGHTVLPGEDENSQLTLINHFHPFDFIVDHFSDPALIVSQIKIINKMLEIEPSNRYDYENPIYYTLDYIKKHETCLPKNYHNLLPKICSKDVLQTLFNWLLYFSDHIFENHIDVSIYAYYIIIAYLQTIKERINPDLQLIGIASLIIADNLFNNVNPSRKKIIKACDEPGVTLKTLRETEFNIVIALGKKLKIITPLQALHFYRQQFPDIYLNNPEIIKWLYTLHISGAAFCYKPSHLVAELFQQVMQVESDSDLSKDLDHAKQLLVSGQILF
jgi:serine/threonine protein kinase